MDKFDDTIKQSKPQYEPRGTFVEDTMQQINAKPKRSNRRFAIWTSMAGAVAVLAIVFVASPLWKNVTHNSKNNTQTTAANTAQTSNTPGGNSGSLPAGTDDASLASDLASIQSSQNQENTDQSSATNTLNDSSQQVAIPTN